MHKHRMKTYHDQVWSYCIAPEKEHDERPHGNITTTARCSCGATRYSETNGGKTVRSQWFEEGEGD